MTRHTLWLQPTTLISLSIAATTFFWGIHSTWTYTANFILMQPNYQRLGRGNSPSLPCNDRSEIGVRRAMMMLAWPYGLDRPSLSSLFLAAPARARCPPGRHLSPVHSLFMIRKRHDGWKTRRDSGPEVDRERGGEIYVPSTYKAPLIQSNSEPLSVSLSSKLLSFSKLRQFQRCCSLSREAVYFEPQ